MIKYCLNNIISDDKIKNDLTKLIDDLNSDTFEYNFKVENADKFIIFKHYKTLKCNFCDKLAYGNTSCINHYYDHIHDEKTDVECKQEILQNTREIRKIHKNFATKISEKLRFHTIMNTYYINNIFPNLNFNNQISVIKNNSQYIIKDRYVKYEEINTKFDKQIIQQIKDFIKSNNISKIPRKINIFIFTELLHKNISKYQQSLSNKIYKIIKYNKTYKIYKIPNNIILYYKIIDSHLINYIDYITTEYKLLINNTYLKADIYMILHIDNNNFQVIIETDEQHHTNKKYRLEYSQINDNYKDIFAIKYGISFIRLNIDKVIKNRDIDRALFCIEYIILTKKPVYYFNKEYIKYKNNIYINNTTNIIRNPKKIKKIMELSEGNDKYETYDDEIMEKNEYEEYRNNPFAGMSSKEICNKLISLNENNKSKYYETVDFSELFNSLNFEN
jgi:hypothetical protein